MPRSGAAQGLSEILAALGPDQLAKLMPEVVKTAQSDTILPHVREGYIMLFVYLPTTFNDDFIPYISDVIPPILKVRCVCIAFCLMTWSIARICFQTACQQLRTIFRLVE